jgi:AMP nucleosidase
MVIRTFLEERGVTGLTSYKQPKRAVEALAQIETDQRNLMAGYAKRPVNGTNASALGKLGRYPFIAFDIGSRAKKPSFRAAFGFCRRGQGLYASTVAGTDLPRMRSYWYEQIKLLMENYDCEALVGISPTEMPFNLVAHNCKLMTGQEIDSLFPPFSIQQMGALTTRRKNEPEPFLKGGFPLALYSGLQTDFARCRLEYYTGIPAADMQGYVVLTNYQMFVKIFGQLAHAQLGRQSSYNGFVKPKRETSPQMPAYSLTRADGSGITLINIGVGPSNAATIMELLQVLRPNAVIMNGHCAGLHGSQTIGQFLLADGYFRRDGIFNKILPLDTQITPVGEINTTLKVALQREAGLTREQRWDILQTGIIASTTRRFWETDEGEREEVIDARAVGLDMESATVAAAAWLGRLPFGTILRISDLPLHGEVKLTAKTQRFYKNTAELQMRVVFRAMEMLRRNPNWVQSRKCRANDDPPVR